MEKMNLQLFAEPDVNTETAGTDIETPGTETETEVKLPDNFDLDGILAKRMPALVKSILKDNGFDEDSIKGLVEKYKTPAAKSEPEVKKAVQEVNTTSEVEESLKSQLAELKIKSALLEEVSTLGLEPKSAKHLLRLVNTKEVLDESGEVVLEKLKSELNSILEDFPALKPLESGFVKIGTEKPKLNSEDPLLALKKAMGLK